MKKYYFGSFPNICLSYNENDINITEYYTPMLMLESVISIFNEDIDMLSLQNIDIHIDENRECPTCLHNGLMIVLSCNLNELPKLVYQFSHELCHCIIGGKVPSNIRWLEESICETASYYILNKIIYGINKYKGINMSNTPIEEMFKDFYNNSSMSYIESDLKNFCSLNPINKTLSALINDPYMREINRYISNNLLPIFNRNPVLWKAIPYLKNIASGLSLEDTFGEWVKLSPKETYDALLEVMDVFGFTDINTI